MVVKFTRADVGVHPMKQPYTCHATTGTDRHLTTSWTSLSLSSQASLALHPPAHGTTLWGTEEAGQRRREPVLPFVWISLSQGTGRLDSFPISNALKVHFK